MRRHQHLRQWLAQRVPVRQAEVARARRERGRDGLRARGGPAQDYVAHRAERWRRGERVAEVVEMRHRGSVGGGRWQEGGVLYRGFWVVEGQGARNGRMRFGD